MQSSSATLCSRAATALAIRRLAPCLCGTGCRKVPLMLPCSCSALPVPDHTAGRMLEVVLKVVDRQAGGRCGPAGLLQLL